MVRGGRRHLNDAKLQKGRTVMQMIRMPRKIARPVLLYSHQTGKYL